MAHDDASSSDAGPNAGPNAGARDRYERTKRDFQNLSFEQQASFLLEATASAAARGLEHAGRTLASEIEDLFRTARRRARKQNRKESASPGPAEPETSQRSAPR